MHWSGTRLVVLASTLLLTATLSAQQIATAPTTVSIPNLIRYGGSLHDASGASVVSRTVGITFAIYPQQDGGAPIWMETQNVTTDAAGNYSVLLGSTTATGLPGDLFSQQEQRWLGVQVQGEPEETRVLLVSVPYAFKAHEAETLGGKSVSDFVLVNSAGSGVTAGNATQGAFSPNNPGVSGSASSAPASQGPTDFSGSTTDQIVGVTQSGTGAGVMAIGVSKGVVGKASQATGTAYGVEGYATGTGGIGVLGNETSTTGVTEGVKGSAVSTSGIGVRATETAATGSTAGVSATVSSPSGIAALFNNTGGGKIISGQNNGAEKFSVDGVGNVNALGQFVGNGAALTGIQFSQLVGQLSSSQLGGSYSNAVSLSNTSNSFSGSGAGLTGVKFANLSGTLSSSQFSGTYSHAVTLSSSSNSFTGNGAGLTGVLPAGGSTNYIQNQQTSPQSGANFDISGNGTLKGYLAAYGGVSGILASATGNAVYGSTTTTTGAAVAVYGQSVSPAGTGVYGTNTATSGSAYGVAGYTASTATNASGVYGQATAATGNINGVYGLTNSSDGYAAGVFGDATATSGGANGVGGFTAAVNGYGVWGAATSTDTSGQAFGVYGESITGPGVFGTSQAGGGVVGEAGVNSPECCSNAIFGQNLATSGHNNGGELTTSSAGGVGGIFENTAGGLSILARVNSSQNSFSVDGSGNGLFYGGLTVTNASTFNYDVQINGNLNVSGTLSKGGGSFKIDDPLDPENKTLSHSFVESPDMMNIYNGNVSTDKHGFATVVLPEYFEALNRDFRYQLTVVGQFAQAIIAREIEGNSFTIRTNKPGVKVSWQVTGIRQDAWANAHRIPVEQEKTSDKRGKYLYPELYGASGGKDTDAMLQH